eukprot:UN06021
MAFCLNISEILLIGETSAVTACVVGISKLLVVISLSQIIFGVDANPVNVTGVFITALGIGYYNYYKYQQKLEASGKLSYNQVIDDQIPPIESIEKRQPRRIDSGFDSFHKP